MRGQLKAITIYFLDLALQNELRFRQFLGATLSTKLPNQRGGRRVAMLERAIAESGIKLTAKKRTGLVRGLAAASGAEAMIVHYDILGLDEKAARETALDMAEAIIDRHLGQT